MGYVTPADLTGATTQYISAAGTQGVDFSLYTTAQLQSLIDRVSRQIDGFCRQTFALTNVQEWYKGRGNNVLRLRKYPLAQDPDSLLSGQSLVASTTTTATVAKGDKAVPVAECSNLLASQFLQWADGAEAQNTEIATVATTSGPGTVTLISGLSSTHASGATVAVNTLDFIQIRLPGQTSFPIPIGQLIIDADKGLITNYTPLMFQNLGYATVFPDMLPLLARYTYGYLAGQVPLVLQEITIEQCARTVQRFAHMGAQGVKSWKLDDQEMTFQNWQPPALDSDQMERLGPWRRNVGFR